MSAPEIAIVDYGVGNIFSLRSSFAAVGYGATLAKTPEELERADKIVVPGVGAFAAAREKLAATGMDETLVQLAAAGRPILGICLGMQMFFERSFENGEHEGLGLLPGNVRPISDALDGAGLSREERAELKVPHIGWGKLHLIDPQHPLFRKLREGDYAYFLHSYYAADCEPVQIATTDYGLPLTAAAARENVMGCQFHPEKSGDLGLSIIQAFCEEVQ